MKNDKVWLVSSGLIVALLWLAWFLQKWIFEALDVDWNVPSLGSWGDTFGSLNALFSALAFIAVLLTLKQQRDQLIRQQEEIRDGQLDQHLQKFERTFYELLRLLREARDDVEFRYSRDYLQLTYSSSDLTIRNRAAGIEAFKRANIELSFWAEKEEGITQPDVVARLYTKRVHSRYESTFAPYYRLLYTLLKRIDDDNVLTDEQKFSYGNLLRSQLTSHEVALCCYNGLAHFSGSFKNLVVRFRLAKYLNDQFGRSRLMHYYPPETFSGRD